MHSNFSERRIVTPVFRFSIHRFSSLYRNTICFITLFFFKSVVMNNNLQPAAVASCNVYICVFDYSSRVPHPRTLLNPRRSSPARNPERSEFKHYLNVFKTHAFEVSRQPLLSFCIMDVAAKPLCYRRWIGARFKRRDKTRKILRHRFAPRDRHRI